MALIRAFDVGVWNEEQRSVQIVSNSTVSDFAVDRTGKSVIFNVTGEEGVGFCRIVIPNVITEEIRQGNYTVITDEEPVQFGTWNDTESAYIYFTYQHSEHDIIVVPEFPSLTVMQLLIMAILFSAMICNKKHRLS